MKRRGKAKQDGARKGEATEIRQGQGTPMAGKWKNTTRAKQKA